MTDAFLSALQEIPDALVQTEPKEMEPHLVDWRRRHFGKALAVVFPASSQAVSQVVALCGRHRVPIYPQGGNTSVCGGSVPDESGSGIVLNLRRMNRIREVDARDNSMLVEAGCVLANIQEAARDSGRLFPMSLGAEGSCQIGGNLATNAGGTAVLRYGNTRDLVLGVEAVMPDGSIWNGLRALRKNNSGYDLRNLLIGSEGTLGIITAAVLKLFPLPSDHVTALIAVATIDDAANLALEVQTRIPGLVSAMELISSSELELVLKHIPDSARPLAGQAPWYVLTELAGADDPATMSEKLTEVLESPLEDGWVLDATIATSERQRQQLWHIRHHVTEANVKEGMGITHDIAVPPARIPEFVRRAEAALAVEYPRAVPVIVGHLGDGNLHYIAMFGHEEWAATTDKPGVTQSVNHLIYDIAADLGGTFSAEHGVGSIHVAEMLKYKSGPEIAFMQGIKRSIDPLNIMNPGRVLPAAT